MIPGSLRGLQNHRTRAVGEQHAGAAIVPVDDSRQRLRAHHQRAFRFAQPHEFVRHAQRVDESGASGLHAERRTAVYPQSVLQQRADVGKTRSGVVVPTQIRSISAALTPAASHGAARRMLGEIGGGLALRRHMALRNARAGANPFVAGID